MYKKLLIPVIIFSIFFSFAFVNSEKDLSLGRVSKMTGKYVFFYSEPTNEYDVAFDVTAVAFGSKSISEMGDLVVRTALRKSEKENKPFDAVIIGGGKKDIAIKFK